MQIRNQACKQQSSRIRKEGTSKTQPMDAFAVLPINHVTTVQSRTRYELQHLDI